MSEKDLLAEALAELAGLVEPHEVPAVAELRRRLEHQRFRVVLVGEAKRGKSTLINALLGREVLPVGVLPVTAVSTTLTWGAPERIVVEYIAGERSELPLASLDSFVTERGNPDNRRAVSAVSVVLDAPLLREGLELVDTPGTGSVYSHSEETDKALATMDAAVFVLTSDPPLSASERALLARVAERSVRTFVVINKADRLDSLDLQGVVDFVLESTRGVLGAAPNLFVCSARRALEARLAGWSDVRSGVPEFEAAFADYVAAGRVQELRRSLGRRGRVLASQALDSVRTQLRLAELEADESAERAAQLRARLDRVTQRGADAADLAAARVRQLLGELNDSAERGAQRLAADVVTDVRRQLDDILAAAPVAELRQRGREIAVETVRDAVDTWRIEQRDWLEQALHDLEQRLLVGLASELAGVRSAARELLDLELAAESDQSRLIENRDFYYLFTETVGWSELLTETIRRHLRGNAARRRAVAEIVKEADRLTRQQVGRVRADFQYRLEESARTLSRAIRQRYINSTLVLDRAFTQASWSHGQTTAAAEELRRGLRAREATLEDLVGRLDRGAAGS